jgi:hypothetical protein
VIFFYLPGYSGNFVPDIKCTIMKLKKNIATSESGFIFNPANGDSFSVNEIGAEIITFMKDDRSPSEIVEAITSKYDTEKKQVEKDLEDFISLLVSFNLVEK